MSEGYEPSARRRVLIVAAHPDDDALGCGGTIAKHVAEGDDVKVIYVTRGELGISGERSDVAGQIRRDEAGEAQAVLGMSYLFDWQHHDGAVRQAAVVRDLREFFARMGAPDLVYTPHQNDSHPDHTAVAWAVREVWGGPSATAGLFNLRQFEIWTPLVQPNLTIDITPYVTDKRKAIVAHRSQHSRNPFCEAILALNHYRGLMRVSGGGVMYAECFQELPRA